MNAEQSLLCKLSTKMNRRQLITTIKEIRNGKNEQVNNAASMVQYFVKEQKTLPK